MDTDEKVYGVLIALVLIVTAFCVYDCCIGTKRDVHAQVYNRVYIPEYTSIESYSYSCGKRTCYGTRIVYHPPHYFVYLSWEEKGMQSITVDTDPGTYGRCDNGCICDVVFVEGRITGWRYGGRILSVNRDW